MTLRTAVLMLALVASRAADADDAAELRRYVDSAVQLFHALDYERALDQLKKARALVHTSTEDVTVSLLEGVVYAHLGRRAKSDAAFRAALTLDPDAKLHLRVSPELKERFEAIRVSVKKQRRAIENVLPLEPSGESPSPPPVTAAPPASDVPIAAPPAVTVAPAPPPPAMSEASGPVESTRVEGTPVYGRWWFWGAIVVAAAAVATAVVLATRPGSAACPTDPKANLGTYCLPGSQP